MTDLLRVVGPDGRTGLRVVGVPGYEFTGSITASWIEVDGNMWEFVVELAPNDDDGDPDGT
jgi:hypothetical protein